MRGRGAMSEATGLHLSEDDLAIQVAGMLIKFLPEDAEFQHVPNGGSRTFKIKHTRKGPVRYSPEGMRFKKMGVKTGWPDYNIIYQGKLYCIELKVGKNTATEAQQHMMKRLKACGVPTAICHSWNDVWTMLCAWKIPLRFKISGVA